MNKIFHSAYYSDLSRSQAYVREDIGHKMINGALLPVLSALCTGERQTLPQEVCKHHSLAMVPFKLEEWPRKNFRDEGGVSLRIKTYSPFEPKFKHSDCTTSEVNDELLLGSYLNAGLVRDKLLVKLECALAFAWHDCNTSDSLPSIFKSGDISAAVKVCLAWGRKTFDRPAFTQFEAEVNKLAERKRNEQELVLS